MIVGGKPYQSIWPDPQDPGVVHIVNQLLLPFEFKIDKLRSSDQAFDAIRNMKVRGAPLIGVTAAFGVYLACLEAKDQISRDEYINNQAELLRSARPTAVNLVLAVDRVIQQISKEEDLEIKIEKAKQEAVKIMEEEKESCFSIGQHGLGLIQELSRKKNAEVVNILTHCNAGWLACVDYGTATSPIYQSHDKGIRIHVWVDETRPRNQGSRLTAWELDQHGIPFTVIVDNAGGHLMQKGMVDLVLVGSDRTTRSGDVANKIGTYLKALAAKDNNIPFYVALPSSSIDFSIRNGLEEIAIEERDSGEVKEMEGILDGHIKKINILPEGSPVSNFGFDITPARLVCGLITEKGICAPEEEDILKLYPGK